jgi:hypothetical protein
VVVTSTNGGAHTPTSWHYKNQAVDFGGSATEMQKLAGYVNHHYRNKLHELIHSGGAGYYVKNGQTVAPYAVAQHRNHVHIAAPSGFSS